MIEQRIVGEIPCKMNHTEVLPIKNWLRKPQRFEVNTEDITPGKAILLYKVESKEFIDVYGGSTRDYHWSIFVYKECSLEFKVTFTNEEREFIIYIISLKVSKCQPLDSFELSTCVRTSVFQDIKLVNPLDKEAIYTIKCSSLDLRYTSPVIIPPHSEV